MTWEEVCEHPSLRNLPFKIETNHYGQVVMSPTKNNHGFLQIEIGHLLRVLMPHGRASSELAVETSDGVKVADVAWASAELFRRLEPMVNCDVAPEICVEIVSPYNTAAEMSEKRDLYLNAGALEVWLANPETRHVEFHTTNGQMERSALCPEFPPVVPL